MTREVPGHPGYRVGEDGTVYGKTGRPLKVFMGNSGYVRFTTYEAGRWQQVSVHVMVCLAFHGPRPAGMHAAHLDGNRWNNAASNLKWVNQEENESHKVDHDTRAWGERHGMARLTEDDVRAIRASDESGPVLAAKYRVSRNHISSIRARKAWRHIQ